MQNEKNQCPECERLKKENARLSAALWRYAKHDTVCIHAADDSCNCGLDGELISANSCLRDLLAPTIKAMQGAKITLEAWAESLAKDPCNSDNYCRLCDELARLRALTGERPPKKSSFSPLTESEPRRK